MRRADATSPPGPESERYPPPCLPNSQVDAPAEIVPFSLQTDPWNTATTAPRSSTRSKPFWKAPCGCALLTGRSFHAKSR